MAFIGYKGNQQRAGYLLPDCPLIFFTSVTASSVAVNWPNVGESVTSYVLKVYNGATLIFTSGVILNNVCDITQNVTGLIPSTTYTFKLYCQIEGKAWVQECSATKTTPFAPFNVTITNEFNSSGTAMRVTRLFANGTNVNGGIAAVLNEQSSTVTIPQPSSNFSGIYGLRIFKNVSDLDIPITKMTINRAGVLLQSKVLTVGGDCFFDASQSLLIGDEIKIELDVD